MLFAKFKTKPVWPLDSSLVKCVLHPVAQVNLCFPEPLGWRYGRRAHQFYLPEPRCLVKPLQAARADPGQWCSAGRPVGPQAHHQPGPEVRHADPLHHQGHGGRGHYKRMWLVSIPWAWFSDLWSQRVYFTVSLRGLSVFSAQKERAWKIWENVIILSLFFIPSSICLRMKDKLWHIYGVERVVCTYFSGLKKNKKKTCNIPIMWLVLPQRFPWQDAWPVFVLRGSFFLPLVWQSVRSLFAIVVSHWRFQ